MSSSTSTTRTIDLGRTECACAAVRRASRAVTQLYDTVLKPSGLKITQFIVLRTIDEAGELPQHRFAAEHAIAVETLSRRLGGARTAGLIEVRVGARGERIYSLSPLGKETLEAAKPYWERAQARLLKCIDEESLAAMISTADRLTVAAQQAIEMRSPNK